MSVCIPTCWRRGLIAGGYELATASHILLATDVLIPCWLNAHAGARYGIPFQFFRARIVWRRGAKCSTVLRACACGWFGIQAGLGGRHLLDVRIVWPVAASLPGSSWILFLSFSGAEHVVVCAGLRPLRFLRELARRSCWWWVCYSVLDNGEGGRVWPCNTPSNE